MKKYNTSLKLLLDDQSDINEGFSRLRRVNFIAQKGAKCELDFPDEYRQIFMKYITGVKGAYGRGTPEDGVDYTKQKIEKDKKRAEELEDSGETPGKVGQGLSKIMAFTETFFGAYATQMLTRDNFEVLEDLFNKFVMDSVPYVYCQALNRMMRMFLPVIKIYLEDIETEKDKNTGEKLAFDMPSTEALYVEYGRKVLLPKVFRNAVAYSNKISSYSISFLRKPEGRSYIYAPLFFTNFAKEFLLNDKFDVNKLKEDIQDFEDIYNLGAFKSSKPFDCESAYENFEQAVGFDDSKIRSESTSVADGFSNIDSNTSSKKTAAIQVKKALSQEYTTYLIVIIEKIFYDSNFVNNIPMDCKSELDQFLNFLKAKLRS
jgi:hypothetical protein